MEYSANYQGHEHQLIHLFVSTFAASDGLEEAALIGGMVKKLLFNTPEDELFVFFALEGSTPLGCIAFSRLRYSEDERTAFILSPVAVRSDQQKKGIGQALIAHGLDQLRAAGVDVALTYGDPRYYARVGFQQINEDFAKAPFALKFPHGWQAQSLNDHELTPLMGSPQCVEALNTPELW